MEKYYKLNYKKILEDILSICQTLSRGAKVTELRENGVTVDMKCINHYLLKHTIYKNYKDFCRNNGYKFENDLDINGVFKETKDLTIDDYIWLSKDFYRRNGRYPNTCDAYIKNNLPSNSSQVKILKDNNISMFEFKKIIGDGNFTTTDYTYNEWLEKYINLSRTLGRALKFHELTSNGLPNGRWFIKNSRNKEVTNYDEFIEYEAKMIPRYNLSKQKVSKIILEIQKDLNRPLLKEDLKGILSQSVIVKHWGSITLMKEDLGLKVLRRNSRNRPLTLKDIKEDVLRVCHFIQENEGRKTITQHDWKKVKDVASYSSCCKFLKDNGTTLRDLIREFGFEYTKVGCGLNHDFQDGEHTDSQYEFFFSKYLKEKLGLKFNHDYYRNVRYKEFISDYNGLLDCDYKISYKDRVIYIEIAGILKDYKLSDYKKRIIKSKSKQIYRKKLIEKSEMLSKNNLDHYIIFPNDCNEGFLNNIFGI